MLYEFFAAYALDGTSLGQQLLLDIL